MFCGIDEAGRGPLAGPLVVAGVILLEDIQNLADSKVLSEKKREKLFDEIKQKSKYHIVFKNAKQIDDLGISFCIKESILEIMKTLQNDASSFLMDGNTNFGIENLQKEIKADAKYKEVSAASILAKVSRDRFMDSISENYPEYNFKKHKGYGTKAHVDAIKEFGRSDIHRFSFKLKALKEV
ncbi:MAG: ribonuclease HII [Aliarcobacter skirrowii]|uniref:ribonuclease HII n=1 Tax=Aliarcobacter skirrowii TaxID=28200 RepID=UPI00243038BC|nr:ribonuclease HII [Aliarcobacter skirrowii]MDD2508520.1 ribonuclease HII [Aliarcobacter skirrowii]MDD3497275.1 ribonuclease HII [Aliarcobacter skirrowii]